MRKFAAIALVLLFAAQFAGCYRMSVVTQNGSYPEPAYEDKFHTHLFFGLAHIEGEVDARNLCPNGVGLVKTKVSFLNGLVSGLTANIYSPSWVQVYCAQGAADAGDTAAVTEDEAL